MEEEEEDTAEKKTETSLKVLSQHIPDGTEEYHEEGSQNRLSPGQDYNQRNCEYEAGDCELRKSKTAFTDAFISLRRAY
jgi:hypothetical protein